MATQPPRGRVITSTAPACAGRWPNMNARCLVRQIRSSTAAGTEPSNSTRIWTKHRWSHTASPCAGSVVLSAGQTILACGGAARRPQYHDRGHIGGPGSSSSSSRGGGATACSRAGLLACSASSSSVAVPELRPEEGVRLLRDEIDTVILDCDGVLWTGSRLVDGTVQSLEAMRRLGKRVLFLTNNASKSRQQYKQKFDSLGIRVSAEEIIPASYCAAAHLQSLGFAATGKKVFLIGTSGIEQELEQAGIDFVGGEDDDFVPCLQSGDDIAQLQVENDIGAVVVGFDPLFSYDKLAYASVCLREIPRCLFVVTNGDHGDNVGGGRIMPVTGSLAAAVERASGCPPVIVGKGGPWLLPWLCAEYGLEDTSRACIVGDRLDTDIALGREGGLRTFLPMTGVSTLEMLGGVDSSAAPDYWMPSLSTLAGF